MWVQLLLVLLVGVSPAVISAQIQDRSPRGEAQWMLERLTGVKWAADEPLIAQMAQKISAGDRTGAAALAIQKPQFLNVTVRDMGLKMSTREETVREKFNDFAAGLIGVVRDDIDGRELLYGNFYYRANTSVLASSDFELLTSNAHYETLENQNRDLGAVLVRVNGQKLIQSNAGAIGANSDPAGILTSRTFLAAHAVAGTNRRLVEYTFREFMCAKMEDWADTGAPDGFIGRDIDRAPGGVPQRFQTTCKGCHTSMDGFRGAFAKYDYREATIAATLVSSPSRIGDSPAELTNPDNLTDGAGGVAKKMNRPNENGVTTVLFETGFVTRNDSWVNNAIRPGNALRFGWRGLAPSGASAANARGVNSFGRLIANSVRFPQCMSKRVWEAVCKHQLSKGEMELLQVSLGMAFEGSGYNFKELFKTVAAHPKCRL
jgi:hypothetical protein